MKEEKENIRFFECDCGCGGKIKVIWIFWKGGRMVDIGFTKNKSHRPKVGIVLRNEQIDELIKYLQWGNQQTTKIK